MPNAASDFLRSVLTAMFVLGFSRVVVCSHWSVQKKLGHDSVFDVFTAPDPTQLTSVADILKMFRTLLLTRDWLES